MHPEAGREIERLSFKTKRISYKSSDREGDESETWSFDIHATTKDGRAIDVEVQNVQHHFYDRVLTYGSALMLKAKAELDRERKEDMRKKEG